MDDQRRPNRTDILNAQMMHLPVWLASRILALAWAIDRMDKDQQAHAPQTASWNSVELVLDAAREVVDAIRGDAPTQLTEKGPP